MKLAPIHLIRLVSLTFSIAGCALLGPDYNQPKIDGPTKWRTANKNLAAEMDNLPEVSWWKKFNDPLLDQLVESALINNNNLQIAIGNVLQAQANLKKVKMNWVPIINLGALGFIGQAFDPGFTNNSTNPALSGIKPNDPQNFNGYGYGFMPNYTLNIFSQIKQTEIAKLSLEMQRQTQNAVRLTLISQVSAGYFSLLGFRRQLELQEKLLADALKMQKYNKIKYVEGSTSNIMITGLDQFISSLRAKIPQIKNNISQSENTLRVLLNQNPAAIVTQNNFEDIQLSGIIPANLPSLVLKHRPDIAVAEYQLKLSNANIGAVTSLFFPSINLTGLLGQGSLQLANLFSASGDFWLAQLGAAMPALNLSLYNEIDKAKGGYYSAYYSYIKTVREAFTQVDDALTNNDNLDQVYTEQQQGLSHAKQLAKFANTQEQQGAVAYADTLGFQLNVDYALLSLAQTKLQQLNNIVNVYQVLGGGYLAESQLTTVKKLDKKHAIN